MKFKRFDKRLWPMFWLGLVVWLGSILVTAILEETGAAPAGQSTLMDVAKQTFHRMPIFTLLLLCVLQPVLEEFAFRLWGVGKLWTTIVCLCLMATFAFSEMGLWALLFLGAFLFVWLRDKNELRRKWLLTLISSACFVLCHVSGFGEFSIGMVLGLIDIFGMAVLMCWLTLNLSIWFSALLHVFNNSLGVVLPLLFLSDPMNTNIVGDDTRSVSQLAIEPLRPFAFAYNGALTAASDNHRLIMLDSTATDYCLVGEPAEIASYLAEMGSPQYTYFVTHGKGESLEERIQLRWHAAEPQLPDWNRHLDEFRELYSRYSEDSLLFDTAEVMMKEAYLCYKDGRKERLTWACDHAAAADALILNSGYRVIYESRYVDDTTYEEHNYCLPVPNPLAGQMGRYMKYFNRVLPFSIEYRDARKATLITINTK